MSSEPHGAGGPQGDGVRNNAAEGRFEVEVEGALAVVEYQLRPGAIIFTHTEVPPELEGRGIAARMAKTALEHAREQGLRVVPLCPYIAAYIERHPEYGPLVRRPGQG
jgi:uncharacterized protein